MYSFDQPSWMRIAKKERCLAWLSRLDEAEPVIPQERGFSSMGFKFEGKTHALCKDLVQSISSDSVLPGVPVEKRNAFQTGFSDALLHLGGHADKGQHTRLEPENLQTLRISSRHETKGEEDRLTRNEKNGYQRIPRPKTREDRYEYKGNNGHTRSKRNKRAIRREKSKRGRKHTINEYFHAPNVPRSRLTLHSSLNMGIFNRGKASSPINPRGWASVGFSEAGFLQKQSCCNHEPQRPNQKAESCHYDTTIHYPESRVSCFEETWTQCSGFEGSKQDKGKRCFYECYTMQLLNFDLHQREATGPIDPEKKYWTLGELKYLLEKRTSMWMSQDKGSQGPVHTCSSQNPRKRKRDLSHEEEEALGKSPKKARRGNANQRLIINSESMTKSAVPSLQATPSVSCTVLGGDVIDTSWDNEPVPHTPIKHTIESSYLQSRGHILEYERSSMGGGNLSLISHAFDAAYEAIMQDSPQDLADSATMEIESIGISEGYFIPEIDDSYEWGIRSPRPFHSSHIGQEIHLAQREEREQRSGPAMRTSWSDHHSPYSGQLYADQRHLFSADQGLGLGFEQSSRIHRLDLNSSFAKGFWRQSRLY